MPIAGECPYFRYERGGVTFCECAQMRFPDKQARRDIVYGYCAHPTAFRRCPLYGAMEGYYERRYKE